MQPESMNPGFNGFNRSCVSQFGQLRAFVAAAEISRKRPFAPALQILPRALMPLRFPGYVLVTRPKILPHLL